jgi:tetratricopeptide (TPR) repeat protein
LALFGFLFGGVLGFAVPSLKEGRERWLRGNYAEAQDLYGQLLKQPELQQPAALGLSRVLQSRGKDAEALAAIMSALAANPNAADLLARRSELLYLRGNWAEAEQAAEKALTQKPPPFLARWIRGQICRDRGDLQKADADFRWFVRAYTERSNKDDDIKDPDELLLVGLAGTEYARAHNLADQFTVILTDVYGDALKSDKLFWPAEVQAGLLLLEKYNRGEALDAFGKALAINPNAAEAQVGKGVAALQRFEVKQAELEVEEALRTNPNLPEALRLRADIHFLSSEFAAARQDLDHARKINPRDERTLARIAACLSVAKDQAGFDALVKEVSSHNSKPGLFYFELAEQFESRRQYSQAEQYYQRASKERPTLPWPNNSLGLLYMRLGREKDARELLTKAFQADEFNVRVANTLKVLRHLEKYETLTTNHFELRFDPKADRPLARYMAEYLEGLYADLAAKLQYQPPGKILVEVFNNHEMFSGRVIALPDLHTIGASTGRMFAMVSPNGKGIPRPFNWSRVLRHEMVHIFNLEQTDFQAPHWLTEGLAVIQEALPRPQEWNKLLRERVASGELMTLDNINLGFIRPRSPLDWHMAYCQSQLYVEYLKSKHGPQAVGELLLAYKEGLDTAAAIQKVCHVDKAAFEAGYREYLQEVVKTIQGRQPPKPMKYDELRKAHEAKPGDLDVAARLAEQCLLRRDNKEARKLADQVLADKPHDPLASYVKARLLLASGDEEESRKLLEGALDEADPELRIVKALGKIYFENKDFDRAAKLYELAHRVEPYDSEWLVELAKVYTQAGNKSKLIDTLIRLVPNDADDLDQRKKLAQLLLDNGRLTEAAKYAREALEINVRDAEALNVLQEALRRDGKADEAKKVGDLLAN